MAQRLSTHDMGPSVPNDEVNLDGDQNAMSDGPAVHRDTVSHAHKAGVLAGSAISQLSIWGFAMSYGVLQEHLFNNWTLDGSRSITGIIGTTSNGVMYISMPFLFALFTRRWAHRRQAAALCGAVLMCLSFVLSSFSTKAWHLVVTQGVMAALGGALIYSPTTLSLGEWFANSNRTVAYGVTLSCKNIVGSTCPFLMRALLDHYGFRVTMRIWAAIAAGTSLLAIFLVPTPRSSLTPASTRPRKLPWHFLKHQTFYIYSMAIMLQSSGYGLPQTYLNTYAHDVSLLSKTSATLLLTLFNIPGICSSSFFGYLCDNQRFHLSPATVTFISAICSALSAWLFWGFASQGSMGLLVMFAITFGFFAGGYSSIWGGILNEIENEAARENEAIDPGMLYGLLNGSRGIGYVAGGFVGLPLLKAGSGADVGNFGYGTAYSPIIIFTGLSSAFGGWGVLWKLKHLLHSI